MAKIENEYHVSGGGIEGYDTDKKEIYWEIRGENGWKECYPISHLYEISLPFYRKGKVNNGWSFSLSINRTMKPKHLEKFGKPSDSFIFREMTKEKCFEMFAAIARDYIILHSLSALLAVQEYCGNSEPAPLQLSI